MDRTLFPPLLADRPARDRRQRSAKQLRDRAWQHDTEAARRYAEGEDPSAAVRAARVLHARADALSAEVYADDDPHVIPF